MGWLIALGIILVLAWIPMGVRLLYDADGAVVIVKAGPFKFKVYPKEKKEKKPEKKKASKKIKKNEDSPSEPEQKAQSAAKPMKQSPPKEPEDDDSDDDEEKPKKKGGNLMDFLPLVKTVLNFLGDFGRKLWVDLLELKLILGADDPCDLAVNYGRAWAAVGNLLPRLERIMKIKKRDIDIECDFTASETTVIARVDLSITVGRILAAVFVFAFHAIVEFLKIMIKRKGGTQNESKSSQYAE